MMDDIYNTKLLEFAANLEGLKRLEAPDATATKISKLCGSKLTVDLKMDAGLVTGFGQDVKACALGQAAASIVARNIHGASEAELRAAHYQMTKMLKENGAAPMGRFSDLKYLEPVRAYKARHASTLLVLDAIVACLDEINAKKADAAA